MNAEPTRPGLLRTVASGLAMGASDLVPGVSGGTMALILGVYDRLIVSLGALSRAPFRRALRAGRLREAWRAVNGGFLATLALGIGAAIVTLAPLLTMLLTQYRSAVYAFFFGLIGASAVLVLGRVRGSKLRPVLAGAASALATFLLVGLPPTHTPEGAWALVGAGALAVSALLLPGVSGAFVLVVLGKYELVLAAVSEADLSVLAPFGAGMAFGLLVFSRLLSLLLRRHHDATLGVLTGVLVGSLRKVWPWQEMEGPHSVAVTPPAWPDMLGAAALALAAAGLVWGLQRAGAREGRPGDRHP